jgi:hypothetical protein
MQNTFENMCQPGEPARVLLGLRCLAAGGSLRGGDLERQQALIERSFFNSKV